MTANGHVNDFRPLFPYAMPAQLSWAAAAGPADRRHGARPGRRSSDLHVGRGLAVGDLDNDGRVDAVVVAQNEPLVVFSTPPNAAGAGATSSHSARGDDSNRDGVGAAVTVTAGGRTGRPIDSAAVASSRPATRGSISGSGPATRSNRSRFDGHRDKWMGTETSG